MNISLKKKIQHWFNFLKLAHQSSDPVVVENLKQSKSFYEAWGNYQEQAFTNWWTEHRHLFRKVSGLRRMTAQDEVDDTALYLVIPFTYAPTTVAKIVQRIYDEEQTKRETEKKKVKKVYGGNFGLSTDEFQVSQFTYYHRYAKDVFLPLMATGKKVKTKEYVSCAVASFAKQKQVTSHANAKRNIPFKTSSDDYANLSKRARDFNRIVEKILRNVSAGVFPGDYLTVSVKNQAEARREKRAAPIRSHSRGVPESLYVKKVKREAPLNVFRKLV